MTATDLILNSSREPGLEEIRSYIDEPGWKLWDKMNGFIRESYGAKPKITYSNCSGKPGWNVKYQKSGKSLCTLYPEKKGFTALIVVALNLVPLIEGNQHEFGEAIQELVRLAKPFNGTLWLMIPVHRPEVLDGVKELIILKAEHNYVNTRK